MARNLSPAALAKLATNLGTEPVNIIEIQWVEDAPRDSYSDRDIAGGVKGKILEVSGLDAVVQVSGGSDSQSISVTLDDTDGSLKAILDSTDIHKRPAWVYQWFDGLSLTDKFLIFKGVISSPIEWNEGDRTLKFDIISQIEDVEVGFSIEEGDFINPPDEIVGKPWPLCFGTVINVPALKVKSVRQGVLATGNGIMDWTIPSRLAAARRLTCPVNFTGYQAKLGPALLGQVTLLPGYEFDAECTKRKCEAIELLELQQSEQSAYQFPTMTIYGGEEFPQGVQVRLDINGSKWIGYFTGETFTVQGRVHPDMAPDGTVIQDDPGNVIQSQCGNRWGPLYSDQDDEIDNEAEALAEAQGVTGWERVVNQYANLSKLSWRRYEEIQPGSFFWANAGSVVTLDSDQETIYIANILPSTILRVAAWRDFGGNRQLLTVPSEYFSVRQVDYTGYQVMEIVFDRPLSARKQGWTDEVCITMTSSIGPNTVDILEWFITTYTNFNIDSVSFDYVRNRVENYPMHFWLKQRKNIIQVLQEIAYQARCALWLRDDTFYIKYLSEVPDEDGDITEDDVLENTLMLGHTSTEDIITKYVAEWYKEYTAEEPNKVILRHNVKKYGMQEQVFDYYCFNIQELVIKTATFWLIRSANTWRRATFSTPVNKLNLEVFDTVELTLPDIADGTIKAIVEKANYNSDTRQMDFEVWTPVKAGTRTPYDFAWPADIEQQTLFPTIDERNRGFAGSGTEPNFSTIAPNNHPLSNEPQGFNVTVGESCYDPDIPKPERCGKDFGDKKPSDIGDTKPEPKATADTATGAGNAGTDPIGSGSQNNSSATNNCCAEALEKAKQAFAEAQQARAEAQELAEQMGQTEEKEEDQDEARDKLPDNNCQRGACEAIVRILRIIPTRVALPPGSEPATTDEPGASGRMAIGTQTGQDCYTFNSAILANAFADAKQAAIDAKRDAYQEVNGEEQEWIITETSPDLGFGPDGQCEEPEGDDRAMVGFTETDTPP